MDKSITYVGLDVHKDTIAVALAEAGAHKDVREYGKVANTATALNALAAKLSRAGSELRFCYEAGPCGYGIQRQLSLAGHGCVVVAPSLIPRKPGDRIKTDRRDAINLAKLHRAGELTAVWIPDQAHEAIRDLVRARLAAVRSLRQARQQLSGFLLRHGRHYNRPAWTLMHRRWMAGLKFEQAAHHIVLEDCIAAVEAATARRDRLEAHIEAALPDWSLAPVVRALQALRGMALVAARKPQREHSRVQLVSGSIRSLNFDLPKFNLFRSSKTTGESMPDDNVDVADAGGDQDDGQDVHWHIASGVVADLVRDCERRRWQQEMGKDFHPAFAARGGIGAPVTTTRDIAKYFVPAPVIKSFIPPGVTY